MPSANPFSPLIEVGGSASAGPVKGAVNASLGTGTTEDNHVAAGTLLLALVVLYLLWRNKFRFSTTVG